MLDEPFVGLDPEASFQVKEMLRELADGGSAVSVSSAPNPVSMVRWSARSDTWSMKGMVRCV